jgi:Txe/YoeB family toxin of Txe-Axe toxin-antitoxin module
MSNIFVKSPYIVEVNEIGQTGSLVQLFIWNANSTQPSTPTYQLSKLIPSSTNTQTTYDISEYVREFITHYSFNNTYNQNNATTPYTEYCNVVVKRYKLVSSTKTLLDTITYKAFDGYGYYEDLYNPDLGNYLLDNNRTFYYNYDANANLVTDFLKRAGSITLNAITGYKIKRTNLETLATVTYSIITNLVIDTFRVNAAWLAVGNKVEILNASDVVQWTGTFKPITSCKYEPVVVDFINKFGGWQREFFFKASNTTINVETSEYNLLQKNLVSYSKFEGQRKTFNTNGKESIKCNTDWVTEDYAETIKQLMLSDRILVNDRPAKMNTKSTELFKSINTKMINYEMTFDIANDIINSVV